MLPRQNQSLARLNLFQKSEFWYNEMEIHASRNKNICTRWDCCTEHGLENHSGIGWKPSELEVPKEENNKEQHTLASRSYETVYCFNKSSGVLNVQFQGHT